MTGAERGRIAMQRMDALKTAAEPQKESGFTRISASVGSPLG